MKEAALAKNILEAVPRCMHALRAEMRGVARAEMTVPQFRILAHISRGQGKASELAEIQGVSLAAMSRMVDGLVRRGLVLRAGHPDRRQVELRLTPQGNRYFTSVKAAVQGRLADKLKKLPPAKKKKLDLGLAILGEVFP
jgi:DNA-binding MarR family transcriptional regulator